MAFTTPMRILPFAAAIAFSAACIALPFAATPVVNDWIISVAKLVVLAVSWNIAANAGLISLGHSAFWGVGSYAAVLAANKLGMPILPAVIAAALAGAVLGAALAVITGRLRGIFFAIATLALSEGLRVIAVMLVGVTGGGEGLYLAQSLRPDVRIVCVVMVCCAVGAVAISWVLTRTPYQYACRAMRANESAAQMLGVNPVRLRVIVLALAGALASLAGGVNIWYTGFLDPNIAFDLHITILAQIAPILGGIHTVAGPVVGSFATVFLSEASRIWLGTKGFSLLVYGVALIVCILFMPHGMWGAYRKFHARDKQRAVAGRAA